MDARKHHSAIGYLSIWSREDLRSRRIFHNLPFREFHRLGRARRRVGRSTIVSLNPKNLRARDTDTGFRFQFGSGLERD